MRARLEKWFPILVLGGFSLLYGWLLLEDKSAYLELILPLCLAAFLIDQYLFNKSSLAVLIIFFVPFSIPYVNEQFGFSTSLPSELVAALLSIYMISKVILKPVLDKKILRHPLTIILFLDFGWLLVSSIFSSIPEVSFKRMAIRLVFLLAFYLILTDWFRVKENINRFYLLYGLGLLYPIYFIMSYHAQHNFVPQVSFSMTRPFYTDHTVYGASLAFILPGLFIWFFNSREMELGGLKKWVTGGLLGLVSVACVLAYSRAAWLSLVVALLFYGLTRLKVRMGGLLTMMAIAGLLLFSFSGDIMEYIETNEAVSNDGDAVAHLQSVTNIQSDASNLERINRWICAWEMFKTEPLTGWGPGTYQFNYGQFQTTGNMTYISTRHGNRGNAHSEYLTYLSEAGFPGFLSFLLIVLITLATGLRVVYQAPDQKTRLLALSVILGLVTWFFHGLFNSFIDQDKMAVLVFGMMAALTALDIQTNPEKFS